MPKLYIFVKENDSSIPPQSMRDKMGELKEGDIMIALDKTQKDLRPFVRGADYEVMYENDPA